MTKTLTPKPKGISLQGTNDSNRIIQPQILKYNRVSMEAFDQLFTNHHEVVDGTQLPPLERCGIAVEGAGKSGKLSLVAGNPRLIIVKCYDGQPIVPRCRAKIIPCNSFDELNKINDDLRLTFKKLGKDSPYCQVCFAPIATIVKWLGERAVAAHNDRFKDADGNVFDDKKKKIIESASDIDGYGPWGSIADWIENMLVSYGELGVGWISEIHFQWKAGSDFSGPMQWRPNVPPTTADRIARMADVLVQTDRDDQTFSVRYTSDVTTALGARVPLSGKTDLKNYLDEDTPANLTSWDYFRADYQDACREFTKDQTRFRIAHENILKQMK